MGSVNVDWDGGVHAFNLNTVMTARLQRREIGAELVALAVDEARAARCGWLHVDFQGDLGPFCLDQFGFTSSNAGLIRL